VFDDKNFESIGISTNNDTDSINPSTLVSEKDVENNKKDDQSTTTTNSGNNDNTSFFKKVGNAATGATELARKVKTGATGLARKVKTGATGLAERVSANSTTAVRGIQNLITPNTGRYGFYSATFELNPPDKKDGINTEYVSNIS
jgi:hypothetical protein